MKIIASCIKFKLPGSQNYLFWTGKHHVDIYEKLFKADIARPTQTVEGFMTDEDKFVDRHEATFIAKAAGQVSSDFDEFLLYSEDIWPEEE